MKGGNKLFLFAGVGLALVAILLGITMSSGDKKADAKKQEAAPSKVTVVRLLQDIEAHQIIKATMVELVELDATEVSPDAVGSRALVVEQAYMLSAVTGDILYNAYIEAPGITSSIEPGMRAISLSVDDQGTMSGLIIAGDYIDVVFEARVNLRRVIRIQGLEVEEDGPYTVTFDKETKKKDGETTPTPNPEEEEDENANQIIPGIENSPYQGKDGSEFTSLDGGDMLEPVAKVLIQDAKIIRVIQPGTTYDGQGQQVQSGEDSGPDQDQMGQLIVEVTPQQAEAIAFMQSEFHSYSIAVRGKDDHAVEQTSGVSFQILMSDGTWSMPWPEPIMADEAREQRGTPVAVGNSATDDEAST